MKRSWKNCAIKIFLLIITLISINASDVKQIKGIEGVVDELEFDYNSNAYGIENNYVLENKCSPFLIKSNVTKECLDRKFIQFFFKLEDKNLLWRIRIDKNIQRSEDSEERLTYQTKILINRQNQVYLIVGKQTRHENVSEIYTPEIRKGNTVLRRVSTFKNDEHKKEFNGFAEAFIVDDKLIIFNHISDHINIKVVKVKSGKQFPIVLTSLWFSAVRDEKDDIYFTTKDACSADKPEKSCQCRLELAVLKKDALKKENFKPMKIEGVTDSSNTETIFDLKLGDRNELYIGIYDFSSSPRLKIKKLADGKLTTIFSQPTGTPYPIGMELCFPKPRHSRLSITPVRGGLVSENCKRDDNNTTELTDFDVRVTLLGINDSIVPMRTYVDSVRIDPVIKNVSLDEVCNESGPNYKEVSSDKEGNIYFEARDFWDKAVLLCFNRTTQDITKIQFEPRLHTVPYMPIRSILFDERDNLWFLYNNPFRPYFNSSEYLKLFGSSEGALYFMKKGTFTAQKIPNSEYVFEIKKNQKGDIFVLNHKRLYVNSIN